MSTTMYEGIVEKGTIRLGEGVKLPESKHVIVIVLDDQTPPVFQMPSVRLANPKDLDRFKKTVTIEGDNAPV